MDAVDDSRPADDHGAEGSDPPVTIARFRNAAEAGYFADELEAAEDVRPTLAVLDDFDAMDGQWRPVYLLQVSANEARRAAAGLRRLLADTTESPDEAERDESRGAEPDLSWVRLAAAFAAGSAVLWAVQRFDRPAAGQARPRQPLATLPQRLADPPDRPWVQTLPSGGRRELRFEPGTGLIVLSEDRDGDGAFERRTVFGR